ncbi:MAG: class I SAM-dependent methyltransferase [Chloroflexi bacterium]|nr:class I SAM-dependent methyltransferase [Chloroflexota bacterium]
MARRIASVHLRGTPVRPTPSAFLLAAARLQMSLARNRLRARLLRRQPALRTPESVASSYEAQAEKVLRGDNAPEEENDLEDFILVRGKIVIGRWSTVRHEMLRLLDGLSQEVEATSILEVGCGEGPNCIALKESHPSATVTGVDISSNRIAVAQMLTTSKRLDCTFVTADGRSLPFPSKSFDVSFSMHCLEQVPRLFPDLVNEMCRVTRRRVIFLEPVPELYPIGLRGWLSRLRAINMDRLRGLYQYCRAEKRRREEKRREEKQMFRIAAARRTGYATNPLNETCLIVLDIL